MGVSLVYSGTGIYAMERYRNLHGNSGVAAYELAADAIIVEFTDGARYLYNRQRPGARHVKHMQQLAREGRGLATYINQHVRERYAKKLL